MSDDQKNYKVLLTDPECAKIIDGVRKYVADTSEELYGKNSGNPFVVPPNNEGPMLGIPHKAPNDHAERSLPNLRESPHLFSKTIPKESRISECQIIKFSKYFAENMPSYSMLTFIFSGIAFSQDEGVRTIVQAHPVVNKILKLLLSP